MQHLFSSRTIAKLPARKKKPPLHSRHRKKATMNVLPTIKAQIHAAEVDLRNYRPELVNWHARAMSLVENLIPWLIEVGPAIKNFVQDVLNAPTMLRALWPTIRAYVNLPKEQIEAFDRQLTLDDVLRASITGEVVSNVVTKFLLDHHPTAAPSSAKAVGRSRRCSLGCSVSATSTRPRCTASSTWASASSSSPVAIMPRASNANCKRTACRLSLSVKLAQANRASSW